MVKTKLSSFKVEAPNVKIRFGGKMHLGKWSFILLLLILCVESKAQPHGANSPEWREAKPKTLLQRIGFSKTPDAFTVNSTRGLAYVFADRMACPVEPLTKLKVKGSTMTWYNKAEMRNDFTEFCRANINAKQDLVSSKGVVQEDIARTLFESFKADFLLRYEARSGLKPDKKIVDYADVMAQTMVEVRIEARRFRMWKGECSESSKVIGNLLAKISKPTEEAVFLQQHLPTGKDCELTNRTNAWDRKKYVSVKDANGHSHPGIVQTVSPITDPQRKGVVGFPKASVVDENGSGEADADAFDVEASLAEFGDGEFPTEKYAGKTLFFEEDYKKGLMPGVPYLPTAVGDTKSNSFEGCKNIVIITHRTCTDHLKPTPAHFTIGQKGEILQHGPIQNAMPAARGHNKCSIHVELSGDYNGKKNGTHQNLYKDLTEAQTESAAAVYAFISAQIEKVYDIEIKLEHGVTKEGVEDLTPDVLTPGERKAKITTKDKMFQWRPATKTQKEGYDVSAVVQHSQVSPDGKSSHHDDYVVKAQMDELLRRAQLKKAELAQDKPILTAEQVQISFNAARVGTSKSGWKERGKDLAMYTPVDNSTLVAPPPVPELAENAPEDTGAELFRNPAGEINPYLMQVEEGG